MRTPARFLLLSVPFYALAFTACDPSAALKNRDRAVATQSVGGDLPVARNEGPGTIAHIDESTGNATFVWGDALDKATAKERASQPAQVAAMEYVADYGVRFGLNRAQAKALELSTVHDTGSGVIIVAFAQRAFGFDVFTSGLKVAMTREHKLVAITGRVSQHIGQTASASQLAFNVSPEDAVSFVVESLTGTMVPAEEFFTTGDTAGDYEAYIANAAARLLSPARVKRVLYSSPQGVEPAYYVEVRTNPDHFSYVVSARTGRVLFKKDLTSAAFSYRVYAQADGLPLDGPQGDFTPVPSAIPDGFEPGYVSPILITLDHGPISTNDPWLPANSVQTIGNNVWAYADTQKPNGFSPGDVMPFITSPDTFDRTYDPTKNPGADNNQLLSAATTLFYVNNFLHDWYYDAGFQEKDGNAQVLNFDRGGVENDAIKAEANDFSGTSNANMSTPADGASPVMQMYAFNGLVKVTLDFTPSELTVIKTGSGNFGATDYDLTGELVLAEDDTDPKTDACTPLVNGAAVMGKIAVIDRGSCSFVDKVQKAQDAGAIAVLIVTNANGVGGMSGTSTTVTIPSLLIDQASGNAIKAKLAAGEAVAVHMSKPKPLDRAGTLDIMIVSHEWGHYISNRLIGNASGIVDPIQRGMGEGWADFSAMLLTVREVDLQVATNANWAGAYALAQYSSTGAGNDGYYYGIRRAPYSTDFAINPLTYAHIEEGVALPALTEPRGYSFGANGKGNSEVHSTGEVWANMLWNCYAALLNDQSRGLSFEEKRERMKRYYVASLKLTPVRATMVEAKDAVLAAALATDRKDFDLFAEAFAKRGLGLRALAAPRDSDTHQGVRESKLLGPDLAITALGVAESTPRCAADGVISEGEGATLSLTVKNVGTVDMPAGGIAILTSVTPGVVITGGGILSLPALGLFESTTLTLPLTVSALNGITRLDFEAVVTSPALVLPALVGKHSVLGNFSVEAAKLATEDVESPATPWKLAHDVALAKTDWARTAEDVEHHFWRGASQPEPADLYLVSPVLNVSATDDFSFTFQHRYSLEWADKAPPQVPDAQYFDGGVIELSTDGINWSDIGASASPTYNAKIVEGTSKSPLRGRQAYSGDSAGYPAWETVTVTLGKTYAGQNVLVRFRSASDDAATAVGWDVDDLSFTGITNKPFNKLVVAPSACP